MPDRADALIEATEQGLRDLAEVAYTTYWADLKSGEGTPFAKLTEAGQRRWAEVAVAVAVALAIKAGALEGTGEP